MELWKSNVVVFWRGELFSFRFEKFESQSDFHFYPQCECTYHLRHQTYIQPGTVGEVLGEFPSLEDDECDSSDVPLK